MSENALLRLSEPKLISVHNIKILHLLKNAVGYNKKNWKKLVI